MSDQSKMYLIFAAVSGGLAVIFGAFGAHALKSVIEPSLMNAYQTGVQYHFYHTFALCVSVLLMNVKHGGGKLLTFSACCFLIGIVLFSGSLYCLALGAPRWFGMITPIGGLSFILGWFMLALSAFKIK